METTDLFFAAHLRLKDYQIVNFEKKSKRVTSFDFDISQEQWKKEKLDFNNSEITKVKQVIESLKDLCF